MRSAAIRGMAVATMVAAAATTGGCSGSQSTGDTMPASHQRLTAILVALLQADLGVEPQLNHHVVVDPVPGGAASAVAVDVQNAVTTGLRTHGLAISWSATEPPDDSLERYVTIPVIPPTGGRFTVAMSDRCGNVCGHSQRYVVTGSGTDWRVTPTGGAGIS